MKIIVERVPANKWGPDVVDPLLTTEVVGIARGTREIDYHSTNRSMENGNCILLPYMASGSLINVTEATRVYKGKLKKYSVTIDVSGRVYTATSAVEIEKEMI